MSRVMLGPNHPDDGAPLDWPSPKRGRGVVITATDRRLAASCPGRWCACLACGEERAARGLAPLPIRIGELVIPSLPPERKP